MAGDELVPWLRAEIEADKRAASPKIIRERWVLDPEPWEAHATGIVNERGAGIAACVGDYAALHIVRHGPLDVIADCEAKLAVLDLHCGEPLETDLPDGDYRVRQVCTRCDDGYWPCRTVRLIGYAYRLRDGYREAWKP
jgi:Family of unknown function (DUF6221)/Nudix N-terminal